MKKIVVYCICLLLVLPAGAAVKRISGGENLGRAIRALSDADTLMVAAGSYFVDGSLALRRNAVIIGEEGALPQVALSSFVLGTGAQRLVLRNLALTLTDKYLVGTSSEGEVEIEQIVLAGCSVDLGGAQGAGLVNSRSSCLTKNRIGEIRVDDCLVFNGGFPLHFVYSAGSTSQTSVGGIYLVNSTFTNMARGIVLSNANTPTEVWVDHCTFYAINSSDNVAGIIRLGQAGGAIRVTASIFHFAGLKSRFIVAGEGCKISVENSYVTGELATIPRACGLSGIAAKASEVFVSPAMNPLSPKSSFCISEKTLFDLGVGDRRWNKSK